MAILFEYRGPLDIASAFRSKSDVGSFIEYMIGQVNEMILKSGGVGYIPPFIYSIQGKVFNLDYNYMIKSLDDYLDNVGVKEDFYLTENPSNITLKNALHLVTGVLDDYYDVVRIRQRSLDISKVRSGRIVEIKNRFYNVLVIRNGDNVKRFSAVPFSASEVKKIVSEVAYNVLDSIANRECFEQVAFGIVQYSNWVKANGSEPDYVTG